MATLPRALQTEDQKIEGTITALFGKPMPSHVVSVYIPMIVNRESLKDRATALAKQMTLWFGTCEVTQSTIFYPNEKGKGTHDEDYFVLTSHFLLDTSKYLARLRAHLDPMYTWYDREIMLKIDGQIHSSRSAIKEQP